MKNFNKKVIRLMSMLTLLTISFTNITKVQAKPIKLANEKNITIIESYSHPINPNATVSFVDPELVGSSIQKNLSSKDSIITPMGAITEVYDHSTYGVMTYTKTAPLVGPREKEVTWKTLARGEKYTTTDTTELTGSVKIEGTVKAGIPVLINQTLVGEISGSITRKWSSTLEVEGPPAPYNTRLYKHAIDYDKYSFVMAKTDYYKVYNGGIYQYTIAYDGGTETISSVKSPVFMSYSEDIIY